MPEFCITYTRRRRQTARSAYLGPSLEKAEGVARTIVEDGGLDDGDIEWESGEVTDDVEITITDPNGKVLKTFVVKE